MANLPDSVPADPRYFDAANDLAAYFDGRLS